PDLQKARVSRVGHDTGDSYEPRLECREGPREAVLRDLRAGRRLVAPPVFPSGALQSRLSETPGVQPWDGETTGEHCQEMGAGSTNTFRRDRCTGGTELVFWLV